MNPGAPAPSIAKPPNTTVECIGRECKESQTSCINRITRPTRRSWEKTIHDKAVPECRGNSGSRAEEEDAP